MTTDSAGRNKILIFFLFFLLICAVSLMAHHASAPRDIWWQMANGRQITETGQIVKTDNFTFTISGEEYLDKYWFFELASYLLYNRWGWKGLTFLRFILVLGCLASLSFSVKRKPIWFLLLLIVPVIFLMELRCLLRGYWLTFIILPIFFRLAHNVFNPSGKPGTWKQVSLLCVIQALWTNLHGEFFWGFLIAGVLAAENSIRFVRETGKWKCAIKNALSLVCVFLSSLINPLGARLHVGIINEARTVALNPSSVEWTPFHEFAQPIGWTALILLTVLTSFSFIASRKNLSLARLSLFIVFTAFTLRSYRFAGITALMGILIGMENLSERSNISEPEKLKRFAVVFYTSAMLLFCGLTSSNLLYHWQMELKRLGSGVITSEFPSDCSEYLKTNSIRGNFLNSWSAGGYLIWHNWPDILVAADGRTAPFSRELLDHLSRIAIGSSSALEKMEKEYHIDGAVVPWQYARMLRLLSTRSDWQLLFIGDNSTVWMKKKSVHEQHKEHLIPENLERFIVKDVNTAFKNESWLSFPAYVYRKALFFKCIGRQDLVDMQIKILASNMKNQKLPAEFNELLD